MVEGTGLEHGAFAAVVAEAFADSAVAAAAVAAEGTSADLGSESCSTLMQIHCYLLPTYSVSVH